MHIRLAPTLVPTKYLALELTTYYQSAFCACYRSYELDVEIMSADHFWYLRQDPEWPLEMCLCVDVLIAHSRWCWQRPSILPCYVFGLMVCWHTINQKIANRLSWSINLFIPIPWPFFFKSSPALLSWCFLFWNKNNETAATSYISGPYTISCRTLCLWCGLAMLISSLSMN